MYVTNGWKFVAISFMAVTVVLSITAGIFGGLWDNARIDNEPQDITEMLDNLSTQGGILILEAGIYKITKPSELSYLPLDDNNSYDMLPENQFILNLFNEAESYKFDINGDKETGVTGTLTLYYGNANESR
jgi:hypothetical protein